MKAKISRLLDSRSLWGSVILLLILATAVMSQSKQVDEAIAQSGPSRVTAPQAFNSTGAINFQGQLTDSVTGSTIADGDYNMRFAIYDASSGGAKKWPASSSYEAQTGITVKGGLFNVQLGEIDAITPGTFAGGGDRYLQIWVCTSAGAGCAAYDDLGRLPISSAAYAQNLAAGSSIEGSSNSLLSLYGSDSSGSVLTVSSSATTGSAAAVYGSSASGGGAGISGINSSGGYGVFGSSASGAGVYGSAPVTGTVGIAMATSGNANGVYGASASTVGTGVQGYATALSGITTGVLGVSDSPNGKGVRGVARAATGGNYGVYGESQSPDGYGVFSQGNVFVQGTLTTTGFIETRSGGIKFPDGTVQSTAGTSARPGFSRTSVDSIGAPPLNQSETSIAIGVDGLPIVSYYDADDVTQPLKVAHCSDLACTSATISTVDQVGSIPRGSSIAIGADNLPIISYYSKNGEDLKVAHCADLSCTNATTTIIDSAGDVGWDSSITIGMDGLPIISYYDNTNRTLKVAHCNNIACTTATKTDTNIIDAYFTSIVIGANGLPVISTAQGLVFCSNVTCTGFTRASVGGIQFTSLAIGIDGLPIVSFFDGSSMLKVAHCATITCTNSTKTTIDNIGIVGWYNSISIGADGMPVISYYDLSNGDLKVAHCSNVPCTSATIITLDSAGDVGKYNDIVIGVDGLPITSYYSTAGDLKVTHCSNRFCVPYARP